MKAPRYTVGTRLGRNVIVDAQQSKLIAFGSGFSLPEGQKHRHLYKVEDAQATCDWLNSREPRAPGVSLQRKVPPQHKPHRLPVLPTRPTWYLSFSDRQNPVKGGPRVNVVFSHAGRYARVSRDPGAWSQADADTFNDMLIERAG